MNLSQTILDNERKGQAAKNQAIIRIRLKELVYTYPDEVTTVLHQVGIPVSSLLPKGVLYATVVKNLPVNSELREVISKMILETDDYVSANGQGWQIFGGALSAVGSILSGLGRSQGTQTTTQSEAERAELQRKIDEQEAARKRSQLFMWIGGGVVAIILVILIVKLVRKGKVTNEIQTA